jgi:hypothetical protein
MSILALVIGAGYQLRQALLRELSSVTTTPLKKNGKADN